MADLIRRMFRIEVVLLAATATWAVLCLGWLFFGSGYQFLQPVAYEFTTSILLSNPETAPAAAKQLQDQGYLSIVDQKRMLSLIVH